MSDTDIKIEITKQRLMGHATLLRVCKQIAGVSGHHDPEGIADYFRSTWTRQQHIINELKNTIQTQDERGEEKHPADRKPEKGLVKWQRERRELESLVESLCQKHDELNLQHETDIHQLDHENSQLSSYLTGLIDQRRDSIDLTEKCAEEMANLENLTRQLTQQLEKLHNEREVLVKQHTAQVFNLNSDLRQFASQIQKLNQKRAADILNSESEVQQLVSEKKELSSHLMSLVNQRHESIALIQRCAEETAASGNLVQELTQHLKARHQDQDSLKEQQSAEISELTSKLKHLSSELEKELDEQSAQHDDEICRLTTEHDEYVVKMECKVRVATLENDGLRMTVADLTKKQDELSIELKDVHRDNQELKERIAASEMHGKNMKSTIVDLQTKNNQLSSEAQNMCKQIKDLDLERNEAVEKFRETEALLTETKELNMKMEFEIKLLKQKVTSALSLVDDYKTDTEDMRIEKRGLKNQLDFRKKKFEELEEKFSLMKELVDLVETKAADSETREKESREELQAMKAALTAASVQFGLLSAAGETVDVLTLCQAFDEMKQRCVNMQLEVEDLKQTNDAFEDMMKISDNVLEDRDSSEEKGVHEKQQEEIKNKIEDLRFKTYKQETMIRKLRYHVSIYHKSILNARDSMYEDMAYVDRAVVEKLYSDGEIAVIQTEDLLPWDDDTNLIGRGAFGKVFLRRYQDEAVAVKMPYISEEVGEEDGEKRKKRVKANHARTTMEALVHHTLADHESFPKLCGVVDFQGSPSLVLEFLGDKETGTVYPLSQAVKFQIPSLPREAWLDVFSDIAKGMKAMHEKGLLHNDLKSNNVLLQWDQEANRWRAYIIDMGKVTTLTMPLKQRNIPKEEVDGYKQGVLFQHLAPEYVLDLESTSVHTDIYSLGKLLSRIENLIRSRTLRELATTMTQTNPRLRPSWRHIESAIHKAKRKTRS